MDKHARIFVAGGRGLVGSAIIRLLKSRGFQSVFAPTSNELDLTDKNATKAFFKHIKPEYVLVAAAKVGGIFANNNYPVDFCINNLNIQNNIFQSAFETDVKKLLFLGSSCIYPKLSKIPIKESEILTGLLEPTNEGYALAKIIGVKLCDYYRRQYGCDYISAMPTNTFGPNDNFDPVMGHMLPSLIYKFYQAKIKGEKEVQIWGTGNPRREIIYVDDVAEGLIFLMDNYSEYGPINIGTGIELSIKEIAEIVKKVVGFEGNLYFDTTKPDGVFSKVMDVSRISQLGWKPKHSLEEGIFKTFEWFSNNYQDKSSIKIHPSYKKKPLIIQRENIAKAIKLRLIIPKLLNKSLDDPEIPAIHKEIILSKPFLRKTYMFHYKQFVNIEKLIKRTPGVSLELGAGGGFLKNLLPEVIASDVSLSPGVDRVENAYKLSFEDGALRAIYMTGVLHHLGDAKAFFKEASRCLREGGYIVMMEPHMSVFGKFFFRHLHHEGNDPNSKKWEFPQLGPLSSANTALPNIIFDRDKEIFQKEFPEFKVIKRTYHTFLLYGLSGGVSLRYSCPGWLFWLFYSFEKLLSPFMKKYFGTMQTIILQRI